ncbi:hypothetical protein H6F73_16365 [Microcoleus sp. FACHB-68]|nr:hypothetical protein [Microcoleus sp. FACHB-68]
MLLVDSQLLGVAEGVRMKHEPIRLCGACYAEVPCRKIQLKKTQSREKHELTLLPECPKCKARFKIPGLWVDGWCLRCFMGFGEIANWHIIV